MTSGERSQELRRYLQRNRFMFVFSLTLPSLRNGPLRGSPRWLRLEEGMRMAIDGTLYAPVPGLPRPGTFGACPPCTALSHNRVRPLKRAVRDTERNTEGIGCALSAGVNRRELPSSIQRGKNGKASPTKCNFLGFYTLGDLEDRVCDPGSECFAFICWRKAL